MILKHCCTKLHNIGFMGEVGLAAVSFNVRHRCIFFKNNVYFLTTFHKGADSECMEAVLCYDG